MSRNTSNYLSKLSLIILKNAGYLGSLPWFTACLQDSRQFVILASVWERWFLFVQQAEVCFLLTMKMFKSHFHFQNTIKPPSRMTVLLPLPHLSPSHPPALSENQSLLKSSLFKTSLCSTSSVTGIKRSFQTHHLFIFSFR